MTIQFFKNLENIFVDKLVSTITFELMVNSSCESFSSFLIHKISLSV
jgi:hypothetical protein